MTRTFGSMTLVNAGDGLVEVLLPNTGEYGYPKAPFGEKIHCFTSRSDMDPFISMDPIDSRMGAQINMETALVDADYKALCEDLVSPVLFERLLALWGEGMPEDREMTVEVDEAVINAIADKIDALPFATLA